MNNLARIMQLEYCQSLILKEHNDCLSRLEQLERIMRMNALEHQDLQERLENNRKLDNLDDSDSF